MHNKLHTVIDHGYDYLSMMIIKLSHVSKRAPGLDTGSVLYLFSFVWLNRDNIASIRDLAACLVRKYVHTCVSNQFEFILPVDIHIILPQPYLLRWLHSGDFCMITI